MRIIKPSSEAEMILEFLKMELNSERYKGRIEDALKELNIESSIIAAGSIESEQENVIRADVLKKFRGWPDKEIFENFPVQVDWYWTEFENKDLPKIRYIEYSYWNELSNYTGSPLEAAKTIRSGRTVFDVPNDNALKGMEGLKDGLSFPPMIFLTDRHEKRYIILEGHSRMTVYGLVPDLFQNVPVMLGFCKSGELKKWYGKMPKPQKPHDAKHLFFARM